MTSWNGSGPIVTPLSQAIQHVAPLGWLSHQWCFIAAVLVVGLALLEAADWRMRR